MTGDCPLIDPKVIDETIIEHFKNNNDYTSTGLSKSYPLGQAVEVIKVETLLNLKKNNLKKKILNTLHDIYGKDQMNLCAALKFTLIKIFLIVVNCD